MKAKELLKPRFEVINGYPNSKFEEGEIIIPINKKSIHFENRKGFTVSSPKKYPHLFRKMNWWEKRTVEQMPKKLKSLARKDDIDFDIEKEEVFEIIEWDMRAMNGIIENKTVPTVCSLLSWNPEYGYIPVD